MATGKNREALTQTAAEEVPAKLAITVIYTDCRSTSAALRHAATLASSLDACIRILLPAIVPFPLPLEESPVCRDHHQLMLRTVAEETHVEAAAVIVYCREYADVGCVIAPHSIVVIGARRRWWRPWDGGNAVARELGMAGHHVIRVPGQENPRG